MFFSTRLLPHLPLTEEEGMPTRAILVSMIALVGSIATMAAPKVHILSEKDASRPIAIEHGKSAFLELESNPSTGYAWFVVQETNAEVIQPIRIRAREHRSPIVGAPETALIRVTFQDVGAASVTLGYRRAFQPRSKPTKVLHYAFNVVGKNS